MKDFVDLLARVFISAIFIYEAYDSIAFAAGTKAKMTEYGITWQQDTLYILAACLLVIGAVFMLIGYRARLAAGMLLAYWLPLTFIVHSFWNDPEDIRRVQSILFMNDIAIAGGLLMIAIHGSGRWSVRRLLDSRRIKE